jgi:hypothetical protein
MAAICASATNGPGNLLLSYRMAAFLYRCPNTGLNVQGWSPDEVPDDEPESYESVTCTACAQLHFVNCVTGKVLGHERE